VSDRVFLGWQYALPYPDPGPRPKRPAPAPRPMVDPGWVAAQRREENALSRPLRATIGLSVMLGCALAAAAVAGMLEVILAVLAIVVCVIVAGVSSIGVLQGERALRSRVAAETERVERFRADADRALAAAQDEHAGLVRRWQALWFAYEGQKRWYAVALPSGIDRVDVAGGTIPGWSALATCLGAQRLGSDGQVTVIDVSGGPVAADLVEASRTMGVAPRVWMLPGDLPRLDLTDGLRGAGLADVLAVAARSARSGAGSDAELTSDMALCERVLGVLGAPAMPSVLAALRVVAGIGDPLADVDAGLLTADEVVRLTTLHGHDQARRLAAERAWQLVATLGPLAQAGTDVPDLTDCRLRVLVIDQEAGSAYGPVLGTFAVAALSARLRRVASTRSRVADAAHDRGAAKVPAGWRDTVLLFGAERLPPEVLDRLCDACTVAEAGLVLAFRTITPQVRARLGRGNSAVAFMRLGNAEDAKAASDQIGAEHRFVLAQLTETVGASVTDTVGSSYTSTVSASSSLSQSSSVSTSDGSGHGRSGAGPFPAPGSRSTQDNSSRGETAGQSMTAGIVASSAWGESTSMAVAENESVSGSLQRSRELIVEPHELQRLPVTSLILSYPSGAGRSVVLADVNPGIAELPAATATPLAEAVLLAATEAPDPLESNLGAPPERLDWRH
jgi:hypothetical protein